MKNYRLKKLFIPFALFFYLISLVNALDPLAIEYIKNLNYSNGKLCVDVKFTKVNVDYRETYLYVDILDKNNKLVYRLNKYYSIYPNGKYEKVCFSKSIKPGTYKVKVWHKTYYCNSKGFCSWNYNMINEEQWLTIGEKKCNEKIINEWLVTKCVLRGENYGYSEYKIKKQLKDCSINYQIIKKKDYECKKNSDNNGEGTPYQNIWPEFKVKFNVNEPLYLRAGKYASEIGRNAGFYEIEILNKGLYPYWHATKVLVEVGFKNVDANGNPTVDPITKLFSVVFNPKASACDGSNYFASSYVDILSLVKKGETKFSFLPDIKAPNKPGRYKFYFLISNGCYNTLKDKYKVLYYKEFDAIVLGEDDSSVNDVYDYYDDPNNFKRDESSFVNNIKTKIQDLFNPLIEFFSNPMNLFGVPLLVLGIYTRSGMISLIGIVLIALGLGINIFPKITP